jgi:hypothetical protein
LISTIMPFLILLLLFVFWLFIKGGLWFIGVILITHLCCKSCCLRYTNERRWRLKRELQSG